MWWLRHQISSHSLLNGHYLTPGQGKTMLGPTETMTHEDVPYWDKRNASVVASACRTIWGPEFLSQPPHNKPVHAWNPSSKWEREDLVIILASSLARRHKPQGRGETLVWRTRQRWKTPDSFSRPLCVTHKHIHLHTCTHTDNLDNKSLLKISLNLGAEDVVQ